MKHVSKRAAALVLALCMALGLSACGNKDLETAQLLVQGNLDVIYLNKADAKYLELVGSSENEAEQDYLDGLEAEAAKFCMYWGIVDTSLGESYEDLPADLKTEITTLYNEIYSHSKYEVQPATKQSDGSYTVKVLIDPIDVMQQASDLYDNDEYEPLNEFFERLAAMDAPEDQDAFNELNYEYCRIILQMVRELLPDLGYLEQKSLAIQVEEDSDGYFTINDDDWGTFDTYIITYP